MAKDKNIVVNVIPLTTIHTITCDIGSYELKEEIDKDNGAYVYEIIRRKKIMNLENSKDEYEPAVEVTHPWQIKMIKCGLVKCPLRY